MNTESQFMKINKNKYENIMNIDYNKIRHQFKNSECGVYSVNFILRILQGDSFKNICDKIITDDQINECRKIYFRFYKYVGKWIRRCIWNHEDQKRQFLFKNYYKYFL